MHTCMHKYVYFTVQPLCYCEDHMKMETLEAVRSHKCTCPAIPAIRDSPLSVAHFRHQGMLLTNKLSGDKCLLWYIPLASDISRIPEPMAASEASHLKDLDGFFPMNFSNPLLNLFLCLTSKSPLSNMLHFIKKCG